MSAQHTSGPWSTFQGHIYAPDGAIIGLVFNPGRTAADYPLEANARLIAAAPDLLEALRGLEPYLDAIVCYASTQGEHEPNRLAVAARVAISRALPDSGGEGK